MCTRRLLKRFWQSEYHDKSLRLMSDETVLKVEVGLHVAMIACTREFFCRLPQNFVAADRDNTEPKGEGPERAEGSSSPKRCFDFVCNVNQYVVFDSSQRHRMLQLRRLPTPAPRSRKPQTQENSLINPCSRWYPPRPLRAESSWSSYAWKI